MRFWIAASAILFIGIALRVGRLDVRPMHGDEAVHAYRLGQLLEQNHYRYDPYEFHGPTLNYFTLIPALLFRQHTYASLTETTLRIVPVFFGLLLVLMPLLLADGIGKPAALIASALTAISPAFVFYSKYYIPEMPLVCFTFGMIICGYRYTRSKKWIWAFLAGIFAGLCFATKETSIIAFVAAIIALIITMLLHKQVWSPRLGHLLLAIAGAIVVWGLFFSSFFTNPAGLLDSFRTFATYFDRAGNNQFHTHPWYYYLELLIYSKAATGPAWTEGFVVILAAVGVIVVLIRKGLGKLDSCVLDFFVLFTLLMLAIYSAIPYKTPWCLLGFYHGMILLAAVGIVAVMNLPGPMLARVVVAIFFLTAATDLALQSVSASFFRDVDRNNPYVYAHPTADVIKIAARVEQVSDVCPAGKDMTVCVVCPGGDYWPLPWYLRSFKNVGWFDDVNEIASPAPVVIASPEVEDRLIIKLYDLSPLGQKNLYVPLFDTYVELRSGVELRGYMTKDLRDKWQSNYAIDANNR